MMKQNIINWYRIRNLADFNLRYRLLKVDMEEYATEPKLNIKNWNQLLILVARNIQGPVSTYYYEGKRYIAIDADKKLTTDSFNLVPSSAKVTETNISGQINFNNVNSKDKRVALDFLDSSIRHQFSSHEGLWKYNNNTFLERKPLFQTKPSQTNIFPGFSYKLHADKDGSFYVIIDLAYKYVDNQFLHHRISNSNINEGNFCKGRRALYQNGNDWYIVEVKGLGKPISEHHFFDDTHKQHVVLEYIQNQERNRYGKVVSSLDPNCKSLFYSYPFQQKLFSGASCLAKLIHNAKDAGNEGIHGKTIKEPTERFQYLGQFQKKYFINLFYNHKRLSISNKPLYLSLPKLSIPKLNYAGGNILDPKVLLKNNSEGLLNFPRLRKQLLYKNGIIQKRQFQAQYIFYPESLTMQFAKSFRKYMLQSLKELAPQFENFQLIPYKDNNKNSAFKLFSNIDSAIINHKIENGGAILILPDHFVEQGDVLKGVHDCVKKKYFPNIRFQCASATKLRGYLKLIVGEGSSLQYKVTHHKERAFSSYLNNLGTTANLVE